MNELVVSGGISAEGFQVSNVLRNRTHICLAFAAVFFLTPFSINNFLQGRPLLGLGSAFIILLMAYNCFKLRRRDADCQGLSSLLVLSIITFIYACFNRQGPVAVFWCYPSIIVFYFILRERQARILNLLALCALIPEVWEHLDPDLAMRATVTLVLVSLFSGIFIYLLGQQQQQLRELAVTDPLTGVFNRLLLETFLERAALSSHRGGKQVTLVNLDLDHFKSINDTYGHQIGDRVLKKFGSILLHRVRRTDAVFRLGGEEFLLLLDDTGLEAALQVAEQLADLLKSAEVLPQLRVTASMGVATLKAGESWQEWLHRSDQAVYRAKDAGRDQVAVG